MLELMYIQYLTNLSWWYTCHVRSSTHQVNRLSNLSMSHDERRNALVNVFTAINVYWHNVAKTCHKCFSCMLCLCLPFGTCVHIKCVFQENQFRYIGNSSVISWGQIRLKKSTRKFFWTQKNTSLTTRRTAIMYSLFVF